MPRGAESEENPTRHPFPTLIRFEGVGIDIGLGEVNPHPIVSIPGSVVEITNFLIDFVALAEVVVVFIVVVVTVVIVVVLNDHLFDVRHAHRFVISENNENMGRRLDRTRTVQMDLPDRGTKNI